MADDKIVKLVKGLFSQTLAGKLAWEPTDIVDTFQLSYPNYSIRLQRKETKSERYIWLTIINKDGDVVEGISDEMLNLKINNAFAMMSRIHAEARRIAMGVNAAIDEILGNMGLVEDEEIPF